MNVCKFSHVSLVVQDGGFADLAVLIVLEDVGLTGGGLLRHALVPGLPLASPPLD